MASTNPVSPKVYAAGIGSLLGPLLLAVGQAIVDLVGSGSVQLPEPWATIATIAASLIGAVIGAYVQKDGLRLPTLDGGALNGLPNGGELVTSAADKLNDPV